MSIHWNPEARTFHLRNGVVSYVAGIHANGWLGHAYFGPAIEPGTPLAHLVPREFSGFSNRLGEPVALEYPTPGGGDYRVPALVVEGADGSTALDLAYAGHAITRGKPPIPDLPSTYAEDDAEAETLEVVLTDARASLEVRLLFTIFRDHPVVARSARIRNVGGHRLTIRGAMSASLDFPDADWTMVQLSGAWARERQVVERPLVQGRQSVSSSRGSSGHEHNPFLALRRASTTEDQGEAYGFSLVYSGNFLAEAEVDPFGTARVRLGINPEGFAWTLDPGEEFCTPEAVLACSSTGLGGISDAYHPLFRERLARGAWRDRPRPILINSWEGTYFDFDEERLVAIASSAQELGIELFVLDDGWFGERDDDTSSLGDWFVNPAKLPAGLDGLGRQIEALGMQFGIWIEPEMVSGRSRLFAEHPDWAVGVPGRPRTQGRNQLVLDMSRADVVDHLFAVLSEILAGAPISYVKWDMNRTITEPYSVALPPERQGEFFHRHIVGVYELYRRLTAAFPEILFESCAGGGGRFDPGLLAFAPQAWTSDNTDAVDRLGIQWGTSLPYPLSSMAGHVSAVPNHQVGRVTPLSTRAAVAFFGVFGYELDPTTLRPEQRAEIAAQVAYYAARRDLFQRGRFLRLVSPFAGDGNEAAWMVVSADRARAVVGHYRVLNRAFPGSRRLRLRGLDPRARYRVTPWPAGAGGRAQLNAPVRTGVELMNAGLIVDPDDPWASRSRGDFSARLFDLETMEAGGPA